MFFNRPRLPDNYKVEAGQYPKPEVDGHQKYEVPKLTPQNLDNELDAYYNRKPQ